VISLPQRGEVWWCELPEIGRRPALVLSRDVAITGRRRTIIAPCTTTVRGLPTEVELHPTRDPVPRPCVASLDSVENISVALLVDRIGRVEDSRMSQVCEALAVATGCSG
jgi:mRNA interferase MazF